MPGSGQKRSAAAAEPDSSLLRVKVEAVDGDGSAGIGANGLQDGDPVAKRVLGPRFKWETGDVVAKKRLLVTAGTCQRLPPAPRANCTLSCACSMVSRDSSKRRTVEVAVVVMWCVARRSGHQFTCCVVWLNCTHVGLAAVARAHAHRAEIRDCLSVSGGRLR